MWRHVNELLFLTLAALPGALVSEMRMHGTVALDQTLLR